MNGCYDDLPFLTYLFFLISFIPCSVLLSAIVVSKFVYFPHLEKIKNEKDLSDSEEEEPETAYEDKYPLSDTEDLGDEIDIKKLKKNILFENTPDGQVIIKYNGDREGFEYWSDKKMISYKYLDTTARRYVNTFNCKKIYIDRNMNIKMKQEKRRENQENEKMKKEDKSEVKKDSDDDLFVSKKSTNKDKEGDKIVADEANKYIYMGKINDFDVFHQKREIKNERENFSFADFKKMAGF
jgi:hypothetical protein